MPALRPYQRRAVAAVDLEVGLGAGEYRERAYRKSTLVHHATGTGKSAIIGACARIHRRRGGIRTLVTAPRAELLYQNASWVERWGIPAEEIGWELAEQRADAGHSVIMASLASLRDERRLAALPECDLWLVDEGHLEIRQVKAIARAQPKAARVGLTATWDRADMQPIFPFPFEAIHPDAVYGLPEAVGDGWLARPRGERVKIGALERLDRVPLGDDGDFQSASLSKLMQRPEVVDQSVRAVLDLNEDRPTLVFCVDLAHAAAVQKRFDAWAPGLARIASGELSRRDRKETLDDFQAGKYQFVLTVALLTYGWDAPRAGCAAMLRPTRSRNLWTQCGGRIFRPFEGKVDALILDFWGGTEELSLVTPAVALEAVQLEAPRSRGRRVENEDVDRLAKLEKSLEHEDPVFASDPPPPDWRMEAVEGLLAVVDLEVKPRTKWAQPSTSGQHTALKSFGIEHPEALDFEQASDLIAKLGARANAGLCTLKQARTLQKKGLHPNVSFETAKMALDRIAKNGWNVPADLRSHADLKVTGRRPLVGRY